MVQLKKTTERADEPRKRVTALFYKTEAGGEPVREWLKELSKKERRLIGEDIRTAELGWPVGMPVCRLLGDALYEVRTDLPGGRKSRVLFYIDKNSNMVLLHAFIKKTQKTPAADKDLALKNMRKHKRGLE
jgi:phage-related protein